MLNVLVIGNSKFFNNRIKSFFKKNKKFRYEIASRTSFKSNRNIKFKNYDEALTDSSFDIVYISLINKLHYSIAKKALKRGYNVIIDKPLALSAKDSLELLNIAKKKKLLLAEAIYFNYHQIFYRIKQITKSYKDIHKIIVNFNIPLKVNYKQMRLKKLDCLSDMSSYATSIIRIFFSQQIEKKNIFKLYYKSSSLVEKFHIFCKFKKNKFLNGFFSFNSEYESSFKFFCNSYILEVPFQAFALRSNKKYELIVKKNNSVSKLKIKDDSINNFFSLIHKSIKNKNYKFFYDTILEDIHNKKKLKLFNE